MGREIRRVPENWEHPMIECTHSPWAGGCSTAKKNNGKCYQPMLDTDFDSELAEWLEEYNQWKNKTHPDYDPDIPFWEWIDAPPDPEYYHPIWENPTWYQVYETVSEGTPVTPPFATKKELIDYLVEYGDFWDQQRGDGGWSRKAAEQFVEHEWAPSLIMFRSDQDTIIHAPRDGDIEE